MAIGTGAAILGGAVLGVGGSMMAGKAAAKGTSAAAESAAASSKYAADIQQKQFEQTREDLEPWRVAGQKALQTIQDMPEFRFTAQDFEAMKDPAYDFRMQEGINALDRSAAARGRILSGAQDKAITRYGSNLASQEYQNAFNRNLTGYNVNLAREQTMAGVGQSATNVISQAGQQTAANIGRNITQSTAAINALNVGGAQAQASMYGNIAQSAQQGIGNYLLYQQSQQGS